MQFDTVQGETEYDTRCRLDWIKSLAEEGYLDRLLLSHDVCLRSNYATFGGPGYAYVLGESRAVVPVRDALARFGLSRSEVYAKGYWNLNSRPTR